MDSQGQTYIETWYYFTFYAYLSGSKVVFSSVSDMLNQILINYYANNKKFPKIAIFNTPIES